MASHTPQELGSEPFLVDLNSLGGLFLLPRGFVVLLPHLNFNLLPRDHKVLLASESRVPAATRFPRTRQKVLKDHKGPEGGGQ